MIKQFIISKEKKCNQCCQLRCYCNIKVQHQNIFFKEVEIDLILLVNMHFCYNFILDIVRMRKSIDLGTGSLALLCIHKPVFPH